MVYSLDCTSQSYIVRSRSKGLKKFVQRNNRRYNALGEQNIEILLPDHTPQDFGLQSQDCFALDSNY